MSNGHDYLVHTSLRSFAIFRFSVTIQPPSSECTSVNEQRYNVSTTGGFPITRKHIKLSHHVTTFGARGGGVIRFGTICFHIFCVPLYQDCAVTVHVQAHCQLVLLLIAFVGNKSVQ